MGKIAYAGATPRTRSSLADAPAPGAERRLQPRRPFKIEVIDAHKDRLRKDYYDVLAASTQHGYPEMATVLNIKLGTVKSRLNRARTALDKLIAEAVPA